MIPPIKWALPAGLDKAGLDKVVANAANDPAEDGKRHTPVEKLVFPLRSVPLWVPNDPKR